MNRIDNVATDIHERNLRFNSFARSHAFDLIGTGLIFAIGLLSLGAIKLRALSIVEFIDILLEAVPFYMASVTLSVNFYKKGVYAGKEHNSFITTVKTYSTIVNNLTGKMLDVLYDFCQEYNERAVKLKQVAILRSVAISYKRYNEVTYKDGVELVPLKQLPESEIIKLYNERVAEHVMLANNVNVKGLNATTLLGNVDSSDITNLGLNEQELLTKRTKSYALVNTITILLLTVMGIKSMLEWGWTGAFLTLFKLVFILCRCYMKYFEGYEDITQKVVNHLCRKCDILKQFDYWYYKKYPEDINELPYGNIVCNNFEKSSYNINDNGSKTGDVGTSPKNVE